MKLIKLELIITISEILYKLVPICYQYTTNKIFWIFWTRKYFFFLLSIAFNLLRFFDCKSNNNLGIPCKILS